MKRTEFTQGWLDALRSGNYEQGKDYMFRRNKYCCLGVGATLCGVKVNDESEENYELLDSKLGLNRDERQSLTTHNDAGLKTLPGMADMIEHMLESE